MTSLHSKKNLPVGLTSFSALQMKGQWESNIKVWFLFMYSQKWNCAASLFLKQNYNVLSPNSYTHICERFIYFQDRSVYFAAAKYVDRSQYINRSQTHECGNWDWSHAILRKGIQYIHGIFIAVRFNMQCTQVWISYFNFLFCFGLRSKICAQRYTVRDRRPSTAAWPACWAMETSVLDGHTGIEIVYREEKKYLYWADLSS